MASSSQLLALPPAVVLPTSAIRINHGEDLIIGDEWKEHDFATNHSYFSPGASTSAAALLDSSATPIIVLQMTIPPLSCSSQTVQKSSAMNRAQHYSKCVNSLFLMLSSGA